MSALPPLPARNPDSHKGNYGRVLVVAGSMGMTGAGAMASLAALRSGAGLVTWAVPESLHAIAAGWSMELIILPLPDNGYAPGVDAREHILEAAHEADAVVLGCGLPVAGETGELMRLLIPEIGAPLLLDAGALRALGKDMAPLLKRRKPTILTPHPGEMSGLTGKPVEAVQEKRETYAKKYADMTKSIVVLKGAGTVVTNGADSRINQTGNPGMATAGTGDLLAGMITGLVAQQMDPYGAACLGVHLHGLAGDLAAVEQGCHGMIAGDMLACMPAAFKAYAAQGNSDDS